jgi:superfamily I DNA/RNA helicase
LSRVEELADRAEALRPAGAADFRSLVPLPEIMSEILGVGPKSKKVLGEIDKLTATFGPELSILQDVPPDDLEARSPLLGEAVRRLRRGEVIRDAGYDGEYGVIRLFEPVELKQNTTIGLFDDGLFATGKPAESAKPERKPIAPEPLAEAPAPTPVAGSLLDGLDPDQRAAAESDGGPLLIIAGPGTGKTRTLTHRIAHLVTERGVAPEHCLAITFTRRAAEEMAERLEALAPEHAAKLTIATFHALGVRILREQHDRAGLSANFGIADQARQLAVLAEVTGDENGARRALGEVSRARRTGTPDDLAERYTKALRLQDLVDFDDLIALSVELLEADPDLAADYRDRYRWISVDEYQDVDDQQYRLLRLLAPPDGNLTAIGDPDQAIYRFRGADVGFFLRFPEDFRPARTVQLTRNYRSNPHILGTALQAIAPGTLVPERELRPMGQHGDALVGLHHAADDRAEASFVARTIDQLLGGASFHSLDSGRVSTDGTQGLGFSDFAVLYRTDRQSRAVMDALTQAGLPFQKRSHDRLAERPGVDQILAELAFTGDGTGVVERVRRAAEAVLGRAAEEAEIHTAVDLLKPLAERCGDDLERFRTELSLGVEVDTWDPRADRVSLLTLHAAKGLEFPVVFVVGCEEGLLPLRWPGAEPEDEELAEERRLLFVGITRAQRHLYLSHAAERATRKASRSRFLADIGEGCERIGDAVPRARPRETQLRLL